MALRAYGTSEGEQILLLLNTGDDAHRFDLDSTGLTVAQSALAAESPADPLTVPGHGWTILA